LEIFLFASPNNGLLDLEDSSSLGLELTSLDLADLVGETFGFFNSSVLDIWRGTIGTIGMG